MAMFAGAAGPAAATPLDQEACKKLYTERQGLAAQGVDKNLEKGPDWAKANLKVADIILVKRYLELYEQIKFRCEKVIAIIEREEPDDENDEETADKEPPKPERKDAATIEQVTPKEAGAKPAAAATHSLTVSAKETKADKETKPADKEVKPAAKDAKSATKETKPANAKETKPKGMANASAAKSPQKSPAAEQ
jgi:hypothetical protein